MDGNLENNQTLNALKGKVISVPVVDITLTKEGYAADSKTTGDALNVRVKKADIVDNLTSDLTDAPLSARQGKVIKELLEDMSLSTAGISGYDNEESGLEANNMQSALDEVAKIAKNAVSKDGGDMIEGAVNVRNADNGYGSFSKNNSATADYGTQMTDTSKDGKSAKVSISALLGTFTYTGPDGNIRDVHHEGNKPFGEYNGNGNASPRAIATGGIGRLILVYSDTRLSFVTPKGSFTINLVGGTFEWIDGEKVNFINGNLNIESTSVAFNGSNTTYYYQVI